MDLLQTLWSVERRLDKLDTFFDDIVESHHWSDECRLLATEICSHLYTFRGALIETASLYDTEQASIDELHDDGADPDDDADADEGVDADADDDGGHRGSFTEPAGGAGPAAGAHERRRRGRRHRRARERAVGRAGASVFVELYTLVSVDGPGTRCLYDVSNIHP